MADDPLAAARQALELGEYGQVLALLEPLAMALPPATEIGADLRLLMVTALIGQGQTERAVECCRSLQACLDGQRRAQARDLLMVLEAPPLQRPRNWSLTLPPLPGGEAIAGPAPAATRRHRRPGPPPPPPPPVGPTRAPLGFALVVLVVLVVLAALLGGCMEVRTDLRFDAPGRLQLRHHLHSLSGQSTPWQRRFAAALATPAGPFRRGSGARDGDLTTPVLPANEALQALASSFQVAADLAGMTLPPPQLSLDERNWLVGVGQHLRLELDLTPIQPLPGLDLALRIEPVRPSAVRLAEPLGIRPIAGQGLRGRNTAPRAILWPLQPGQRNRLDLRCWRWNALGLGGLAVALALVLVLALQRIRLRLGYGLPQLPA